jgi:AAA+ ATPase superfamily predicted ATPase
VTHKKAREIKTGSIYALSDNFMIFWYTYVFPTRSMLEINREAVVSKIADSYDHYLGHIFEEIVKQFLIDLKDKSISVQWQNEERKEYFAVIAKKIENKAELKEKRVMAFDLEDISVDEG